MQEDDDDGDWEAWGGEAEIAPTKDLFSDRIFESAAECLAHQKATHNIDLAKIAADLRLDIYGRVKLINYVRSRSADQPATVATDLQKAAAGPRASWPWNGDQYFTPVVAEDPLLCSLGDADDDDVAMMVCSQPGRPDLGAAGWLVGGGSVD